jgi:cytochrome oxidase Cu insertion factor (SCO1/SenC/PrrC family)
MLLALASLLLAMAESPSPRPTSSPSVDPASLGPAVGQPIPPFEAHDQDGRPRDFASLAGPNGLVLVFFRSADW